MGPSVETYYLSGNGRVPNSRLPLLVYRNVFQTRAADMEDRLRENGWNPSWHSPIGFFPRHHFHSQSHELIAVVRGEARGLFGGHDGKEVTLKKGDVVVIPAGVGHCGISITDDLFVTGAFPSGFGVLDFRHGEPEQYHELVDVARSVPIPPLDPLFGAGGPLPEIWTAANAGGDVQDNAQLQVAADAPYNSFQKETVMTDTTHNDSPDFKVFNSLTESAPFGYAKPVGEFDESEVSFDHPANLQRMIEMLVEKRRHLAQDAIVYQMTYAGRSHDIAKIQPLIEALERALQHEKKLVSHGA